MLLSCAKMEVALLFSDLHHYVFDKVSVCVWWGWGGYNLGYKPCIIQRESIILSEMFSTGSLQQHLINKTWIQQII